MKIFWTSLAMEDLQSIYDFIAESNQRLAAYTYNTILDEVEILKKFPQIASIEPLLRSLKYKFRSLVIISGKYKIIYFVDNKTIIITHVWDCRRDPQLIRKGIGN